MARSLSRFGNNVVCAGITRAILYLILPDFSGERVEDVVYHRADEDAVRAIELIQPTALFSPGERAVVACFK